MAAVAALLKSAYPKWTAEQIVAQIEQTAERSIPGHDRLVGWGVIDPVKALTAVDPAHPVESPAAEQPDVHAKAPNVPPLHLGETAEERNTRLGTYVAVGTLVTDSRPERNSGGGTGFAAAGRRTAEPRLTAPQESSGRDRIRTC